MFDGIDQGAVSDAAIVKILHIYIKRVSIGGLSLKFMACSY
jgi:hypothetical protein